MRLLYLIYFDIATLPSSAGVSLGTNPQPQFLVALDEPCNGNTVPDGVPTKMSEVADVKISGVEVDRALGGVTASQIGGRSIKDVSSIEAVGHRYAIDGKIKKVSFVRAQHFSDLDFYLGHLRASLTTTFQDLLDCKQGIKFWVAVYVRYSHQNKTLTEREPIVLHRGKRLVTRPLVLEKQLDSLIDSIRERHTMFNRNISGLVLDEIIERSPTARGDGSHRPPVPAAAHLTGQEEGNHQSQEE